MHLTTDLTFEPIDEGAPERRPASRLLCAGREAGKLQGSCIETGHDEKSQSRGGRRFASFLAILVAASLSLTPACRQPEPAEPLRAKPSSLAAPVEAVKATDASAPLMDASSAPQKLPIHFDTEPPKDDIDVPLLKTVAREASLVADCQVADYKDVTPFADEIYVYLDVGCSNVKAWKGKWQGGELHFLWQIERQSHVPPTNANILVFLKPRKRPITDIPSIEWVAVETGLFDLTPKLRKIGPSIVRQTNKAKP